MPKHNVYLNLPKREIGKNDACIDIYQNDEKLGEIRLSKGGFDYYPNKKKKPITISWTQFDDMIRKFGYGD